MPEIEILMVAVWGCFVAYAIWYSTSAKHYAPLTHKEARILWKIHKRSTPCHSNKWREIKRGGKTIGFECKCGYKHTQKRPIVANTPTLYIQDQTSTFDKLHTSHKSG